MEGTCNECVFPLTEEERKRVGICPTDTSLVYAAAAGKLSCVKELIAAGADVKAACECHGNGPLLTAAIQGQSECLRELIDAGADVNIQNQNGQTALMLVPNCECLSELIDAGANVNMRDYEGSTALINAAMNGIVNLQRLIAAGADVNQAYVSGFTPLMAAAHKGHIECLKKLIDAGSDVNQECKDGRTALMFTADSKCLAELIDGGADVNMQDNEGSTTLIYAALNGIVDLQLLITAGVDLNTENTHGFTPLLAAAKGGHVECLKRLIAVGAEVNKQNTYGVTVLMKTAWWGQIDCLTELLKAGAETNVVDHNGDSPLMFAVTEGHDACIKILIGAGAHVNLGDTNEFTCLMAAALEGHLECLKKLVASGAEIDKQDKYGMTALIYAAKNGHTDCLKLLLEFGADLNIVTNSNNTALLWATYDGHSDCAKELMARGADVNARNKKNGTPLVLAAFNGKVDLVRMLISLGADLNVRNNIDRTPLMISAVKGHVDCAQTLLHAGADVNLTTENADTALILSALQGNVEIVKMLITAGADVNTGNQVGSPSLMLAAGHGHVDCAKELIEHGADVNIKNIYQETALIYAVEKENVTLVKLLVTAGADVNMEDMNGSHALILAASVGNVYCVKELVAAGTDVNKLNRNHETAFTQTIKNGYINCAKELIAAGADVNISSGLTLPPLINFVESENEDFVKELLEAGADVNSIDDDGNTSLMRAVQTGNKNIVQLLIDSGANINAENNKGETALYLAVTKGHTEFNKRQTGNELEGSDQIVYMLLVAEAHLHHTGSGLNPSTVHKDTVKFRKPNPKIIKMLSAGGANINDERKDTSTKQLHDCAKDYIRGHLKKNHPDKNLYITVPQLGIPKSLQSDLLFYTLQNDDQTLKSEEMQLLLKVSEGDMDSVVALIKAGVDVDVQNENAMTPLMIASQNGNLELIEQLIKAESDLNIQALFGDTALIYATRNQQTASVQKLLEHGAKINIQGKDGDTALMHAAKLAHSECLHSLVDCGANLNIQNDNGSTALILTATRLNDVEKLVTAGADVNCVDVRGNTALINASGSGNIDCVRKLIEAGADVNIGCFTPLMAAAQNGQVECVKLLIQEGADLNIQNTFGWTALVWAGVADSENCFNTLLKAGAEIESLNITMRPIWKQIEKQLYSRNTGDQDTRKLLEDFVHHFLDLIKAFWAKYFLDNDVSEKEKAELLKVYEQYFWEKFCNPFLETGELPDINCEEIFQILQDHGIFEKFVGVKMSRRKLLELGKNTFESYSSKSSTDVYGIEKGTGHIIGLPTSATKSMIKQLIEAQHNLLKRFFEARGTPDLVTNPKDVEILTAVLKSSGRKSPLKLSTLCKKMSKMDLEDVIPITSGCPMTTTRRGRRYLATVAKGEATSLQGDKSDVKLEMKEGCPKRAYLMEVRTDPPNFRSIIPDDECFISPIVGVLSPAETSTSSYILRIPHCLDENDDKTKVKVRMIHENRNPAVVQVPKGNAGALYYDIDDRFIELHTTHFCQVICTICETPYHCLKRINTLWFAKFDTEQQIVTQSQTQETPNYRHDVEIRPYFGGAHHVIVDFRKSVEAAVNLRYITYRTVLKTSTGKVVPQSGRVTLSLQVQDECWKDRFGQWDATTRTFTEVKELLEVIDEGNCHRCHSDPIEAGSYCLQAEGEMIEKFRANARAELTVDIAEDSEQEEKTTKRSAVDVCVDFPREEPENPSATPVIKRKADSPESTTDTKHRRTFEGTEGFHKFQTQKTKRISKEKIDEMVEAAGFDKLPASVSDREIARLAPLFSPHTLEAVALQHFDISEAMTSSLKASHRENIEAFKRHLLHIFRNKGHSRKDLYRILLKAESEGILHDVDMVEVEKMILDPEIEEKSRKPLGDVNVKT